MAITASTGLEKALPSIPRYIIYMAEKITKKGEKTESRIVKREFLNCKNREPKTINCKSEENGCKSR